MGGLCDRADALAERRSDAAVAGGCGQALPVAEAVRSFAKRSRVPPRVPAWTKHIGGSAAFDRAKSPATFRVEGAPITPTTRGSGTHNPITP
jgi:hypothetical protein